MWNNNSWGNNGMGANMGTGFANTNTQTIPMNQTLTKEECIKLQEKGPKFSFNLTETEYLRAICAHKDPVNGNISLKDNNDGTHTCGICHETFTLLDPDKFDRAAIEDICADFNDLFQTIKTMYGPVPIEAGRDFYSFVGFIPHIPELYEVASEYFGKIENTGRGVTDNRSMHGANLLYAMMNPQYPMGVPMGAAVNAPPNADANFQQYQQWLASQQQAQQQGQPQFQQPTQSQFGSVQTPNANFAAGQPNPAYAPQNNGFVNPIGFVEENQTAAVGAPPTPAANVTSGFRS